MDPVVREIRSIGDWPTNAALIADVAALGWITDEMTVLDATYGHGKFWSVYRPPKLLGIDINPAKSEIGSVDFRALPFHDEAFDVVVLDPDYKLSGTPSLAEFDERYGIEEPTRWQDRMAKIANGASECARVAGKHLIVKCQDQVVSGKMRWQTDVVTEAVTTAGFRKADRFDYGAGRGRPQPSGRSQKHARHEASQLLVFTRGSVENR